jgi:hypothetical protein
MLSVKKFSSLTIVVSAEPELDRESIWGIRSIIELAWSEMEVVEEFVEAWGRVTLF